MRPIIRMLMMIAGERVPSEPGSPQARCNYTDCFAGTSSIHCGLQMVEAPLRHCVARVQLERRVAGGRRDGKAHVQGPSARRAKSHRSAKLECAPPTGRHEEAGKSVTCRFDFCSTLIVVAAAAAICPLLHDKASDDAAPLESGRQEWKSIFACPNSSQPEARTTTTTTTATTNR